MISFFAFIFANDETTIQYYSVVVAYTIPGVAVMSLLCI